MKKTGLIEKEMIKASRTGLVNFISLIFWFFFFLQLFMLDDPGIKIKDDFFSNILVMVAYALQFPDDGKELEGLPGICRYFNDMFGQE